MEMCSCRGIWFVFPLIISIKERSIPGRRVSYSLFPKCVSNGRYNLTSLLRGSDQASVTRRRFAYYTDVSCIRTEMRDGPVTWGIFSFYSANKRSQNTESMEVTHTDYNCTYFFFFNFCSPHRTRRPRKVGPPKYGRRWAVACMRPWKPSRSVITSRPLMSPMGWRTRLRRSASLRIPAGCTRRPALMRYFHFMLPTDYTLLLNR